MSTERQESKLIRNLGFWDLMAIAIGQIIGAGIMSSTGVAIGMTGTGVVLAFLLSPFLTIICIFPVAILSSAVPTTGGPYRYCSRLMGKSTGMIYLLLHVNPPPKKQQALPQKGRACCAFQPNGWQHSARLSTGGKPNGEVTKK